MKFKESDIDGNKVVVFNVSDGMDNWSQRNNKYSLVRGECKVNWASTCNVTAYTCALEYAGYSLYSDLFPEYERFPDKLAAFLCTDKDVDNYYKTIAPQAWAQWDKGLKNAYTPVEVHSVLCYGVNKFMGGTIATFNSNAKISEIEKEVIVNGRPVVTSGKFGTLNHIVTLVGFIYRKSDVAEYLTDDDAFVANVIGNKHIIPQFVIIDDPWGETYNYGSNKVGNDVKIPWSKFISDIKPLGNTNCKFAHFFSGAMSVV